MLRSSPSAATAPADMAGQWAELRLPADDGEMPDDTHDTMGYPPRTLDDEYPEPIKGGVHRDGSGIQHPVVLQVSVLMGSMSLFAESYQTKPACSAAGLPGRSLQQEGQLAHTEPGPSGKCVLQTGVKEQMLLQGIWL